MIDHNEWMVVGLITSPHGINGKVKVKSLSDFEERFTKPGIRWIQKEKEIPIKLEIISGFKQPGKESFIISFKGVNNRTQAENLKNHKVLVKSDDIPELQNDEFHCSELINMKVKILINNQLEVIGEVMNLENEKNHLLEIKLFKNNKNVLVPFVKEIVPLIDIKNNFLLITPPKGLLEL